MQKEEGRRESGLVVRVVSKVKSLKLPFDDCEKMTPTTELVSQHECSVTDH